MPPDRASTSHSPPRSKREGFPCFWTLTRAAVVRRGTRAARSRRPPAHRSTRSSSWRAVIRIVSGTTCSMASWSALDVLGAVSKADRDEALVIVYRILFLLFVEARDLVPRGHPIYESGVLGRPARHARRSPTARPAARGTRWPQSPASRVWAVGRTISSCARSTVGCSHDGPRPTLEARHERRRSQSAVAERDEAMRARSVALGSRQGRGRPRRDHLRRSRRRATRRGVRAGVRSGIRGGADLQRRPEARPIGGSIPVPTLQRKQTGTFYTPQPLAEFVVRRTLAPLVAGRAG